MNTEEFYGVTPEERQQMNHDLIQEMRQCYAYLLANECDSPGKAYYLLGRSYRQRWEQINDEAHMDILYTISATNELDYHFEYERHIGNMWAKFIDDNIIKA